MNEKTEGGGLVIGVSHHCIGERGAPAESARLARAEGLDLVEFFGCDFTDEGMREIRRACEGEGIAAAWHPWLNLAGLGRAAEIAACLEALIADAGAMGARNIVIHMGEAPPDERGAYISAVVEGFAAAAPAAREAGVRFCVENEPTYMAGVLGDGFEDFDLLLSSTSSEAVGFTLDTGHALITGGLDEWIAECGCRLGHVHLASNDGASDLHQGYPRGILDWEATIRKLLSIGFCGPFNMEFPFGEGGRELRDFLRRLGEDTRRSRPAQAGLDE